MVRLDPKKIKQVAIDAQAKIAELAEREKLQGEKQKQKQKAINRDLLRFEKAAVLEAFAGYKEIAFSFNKELIEICELLISRQFTVDKLGRKVKKNFELEINDVCDSLELDVMDMDEINNENVVFIKQAALDLIADLRGLARYGEADLISDTVTDKIKEWHESIYSKHEALSDDTIRVMKRISLLFSETLKISTESEKITLIFSWKNQDWLYGARDSLINPRVLNWISSGTGQGFFKNINEAIESAAANGFLNLNLEISSLGINQLRWGSEEAFKVECNKVPQGVIPFNPALLCKIMKYLGFSYSQDSDIISIQWS